LRGVRGTVRHAIRTRCGSARRAAATVDNRKRSVDFCPSPPGPRYRAAIGRAGQGPGRGGARSGKRLIPPISGATAIPTDIGPIPTTCCGISRPRSRGQTGRSEAPERSRPNQSYYAVQVKKLSCAAPAHQTSFSAVAIRCWSKTANGI
jgi:hypothetical protein